jgi:hypothetical protein
LAAAIARETALASLPLARRGLEHLQVDARLADQGLGLIEERLLSRQTGAAWQLAQWAACEGDVQALTLRYAEHQASGLPAHRWAVI